MSSSSALISARPWDWQDAREGLLEYGTHARIGTKDGEVGVVCEPLIRRDNYRRKWRALRLDLPEVLIGKLDPDNISIRTEDGSDIPRQSVDSPGGSLRFLVPCYDRELPIRIDLHSAGDHAGANLILDVPREWTIHLVHHSHLDIGYTDTQPQIHAEQRSFVDSAIDLCSATDDWPEDAQFRWAVESRWVVDQWLRLRPESRVEELLRRIRDDRIELSALPFNMHLDTCSTDELHELLRPTLRMRESYGLDITTAMQTDVPGHPVGLPKALSDAGVRYLSVAHNWAGRSMPHTNGGEELPRLFEWRSPTGEPILVWMTDSPHGLAYMEGPILGFHESYGTVDKLLPSYLYSLASNSYPYPPGTFGWHGEEVTNRDPYPWDILHLRTQGFIGDNAPARIQASTIVKRWNETWDWPRLKTATNRSFFEDAEARLGDQIPIVEGDWGDWWVEGVGSAALPQSIVRDAQARVTDAQFVSQAAWLLGGDAEQPGSSREEKYREESFTDASYAAISLFNEHTWGASNSWNASDFGKDSGDLQWHWKASRALDAEETTSEFLEVATARLAECVSRDPFADASFIVLNTQAWTTPNSAEFLLREAVIPLTSDITIIDARTGYELPHVETDQTNFAHREAGRRVRVSIPSIPGLGYVRLDVRATEDRGSGTVSTVATLEDSGTPSDVDAGNSRRGASLADSLVIENDHLRVTYDDKRSCIASIIEKQTGREIVDRDSPFGFGQYVYDEYTTAGGFNHQSNKTESGPKLELLGSRSLPRPSVVLEASDDGVEQRLVVEFAGAGVEHAWTTLRLRRNESVLRIEHRLRKEATRTKESAYFAFPFALTNPAVRYEITGGVTGSGLPSVPGAPEHMRAVRNWVSLESETEGSVVWVTRNAPLVETGTIALPYAPFPESAAPNNPATVFSWVHNNIWDTNFPIEQAFETTFEYAIGVPGDSGRRGESLAAATAAAVVHPPVVIPVGGGTTVPRAQSEGELVNVHIVSRGPGGVGGDVDENDFIKVVSVTGGKDRSILVKLQSFSPHAATVRVSLPQVDVREAQATSYLENGNEPLSVESSAADVELGPWDVKGVRLVPTMSR